MPVTPAFVPQPVKVESLPGTFVLNSKTPISFGSEDEKLASLLQKEIASFSGFKLPLKKGGTEGIILKRSTDQGAVGAYRLKIESKQVTLEANGPEGLFYAFQTLRQALPPQATSNVPVKKVKWEAPCLIVEDEPRFQWRGAMLDVARHFFPVSYVKRFIDLLALHKMNVFHWHLTEDQGWRLEIKKYPKLTEVGAWRKETIIGRPRKDAKFDGVPHGGFYTQEQAKEIVAYAAERYINVVPEIEMPGHAQAAIAAYPHLGGTGEPIEVYTTWGVNPTVFNVKEETISFLQDVLAEVLDIFPSKFIHIGGDECPKDQWKKDPHAQEVIKREGLKDEHELQSWFIKRMDNFLDKRGRRLLGWDEILEGGLAEGATVMSWRGMDGGIQASSQGHDVVMAPTTYTYLDYGQSRNADAEPINIGGYLPMSKVYEFEPVAAAIPMDKVHHVLGGQCQLWTEYIKDGRKLEYMAFPRLCAVAECVWSPSKSKDWKSFRRRMVGHLQRLDAREVNFRPMEEEETLMLAKWVAGKVTGEFQEMTWDITKGLEGHTGPGTVIFQYTSGGHRLDIEWVELLKNGAVVARLDQYGITGIFNRDNRYALTFPASAKGDKIEIRARVKGDGGGDSNGDIMLAVPTV